MKSSRRSFLLATGTAVLSSNSLLSEDRKTKSLSHEVLSTAVISKQKQIYHGWPTLTRRRNGQLILVWSGGREAHVCPFGRVDMMRSNDNGKTWTWPRTLIDSAIDDRDAGVVETAKGSLLVTTFTSLAYEPGLINAEKNKGSWSKAKLARWQAARDRISAARRKEQLGVWMTRSTDGGISWSARYRCQVNSPHGPIQLSDGRLLYAGKELWQGENRIGVCQSTDDGRSWEWLATIPTRKGDDHRQYHELHVVESEKGKLIAHIRNHNRSHSRETLQTESTDGGKTWSAPHSIGVWGLPSFLLRLRDGRLMMSYGHRRKPYGNQVRLSEDQGKTWSKPLLISGDGIGGDLGYPSTVELSNGTFVTVWYEKMKGSPMAVLRQAHWKLTG